MSADWNQQSLAHSETECQISIERFNEPFKIAFIYQVSLFNRSKADTNQEDESYIAYSTSFFVEESFNCSSDKASDLASDTKCGME